MSDISIVKDDIKLGLRSAVIIETEEGYIFEKDNNTGIYFIVGGGIKINESSEEAAKREIYEELGIKIDKIELKAIVERFFTNNDKKYHEIGFYYFYKMNKKIIENKENRDLCILKLGEIKNTIIKPKIIYDIIKSKNNNIIHVIMDD